MFERPGDVIREDEPYLGATTSTQSAPTPRAASSRWARVGGAISLLYVLWYLGDLWLFDAFPARFNAAHRFYDTGAMRIVFALAFVAMAFHGLNGLRVALTDLRPALARREPMLRAAVRFATFAVSIPVSLVLVWPAVRVWIAG